MLISDLCWTAAYIIFKFVSGNNDFVSLLAYESAGWTIGGAIVFILWREARTAFFETTRTVSKSTLAIIALNESIYILAKLLVYLAIALGTVSIVSVLGSTQVFFAIATGWILTLIAPKIFKEDITAKGLLTKFFLGIIVLVGIILVSQ